MQAIFSLAVILVLIPSGFAGEKIVRGEASRFRQAAKVAMKFASGENFLKVVGFQLSTLFTSLLFLILIAASIKRV